MGKSYETGREGFSLSRVWASKEQGSSSVGKWLELLPPPGTRTESLPQKALSLLRMGVWV